MTTLEIGRPALAVVDMQNDFVDPEAGSYAIGAEKMVTRIGRVISAARRAGIPIIYSQEIHRSDGLDGGRLLRQRAFASVTPISFVRCTAGSFFLRLTWWGRLFTHWPPLPPHHFEWFRSSAQVETWLARR